MWIVNKSLLRSKWVFCGYNWNFQLIRVNYNFYDRGKSRNGRRKQVYNETSFPQFWRDLNCSGQSMFQRPFRELTRKWTVTQHLHYITLALMPFCTEGVSHTMTVRLKCILLLCFNVNINMLPMQLHQYICQYYLVSINYLV